MINTDSIIKDLSEELDSIEKNSSGFLFSNKEWVRVYNDLHFWTTHGEKFNRLIMKLER